MDDRAQEEHYREVAARLRLIADLEPLPSVRRHLQWLAKEHDEVADAIRAPELRAAASLRRSSLGYDRSPFELRRAAAVQAQLDELPPPHTWRLNPQVSKEYGSTEPAPIASTNGGLPAH